MDIVPETDAQRRFFIKVSVSPSGCWEWQGERTSKGYGRFYPVYYATGVLAHRFAYEIIHGAIPRRSYLKHLCGNPGCVNPAHLIIAPRPGRPPKSVAERFWRYVLIGDGCWEWTGTRYHRGGYGQLKVKGKTYRAHRLSWELAYGDIPDDLLVCHRCDNPPCVRPDHLFLGTVQDNITDRDQKGRTVTWNKRKSA